MSSASPPRGFERPPHLLHERSGLRAWLTEPAGVLTQVTTQVRGDLEMARFLSTTVSDAVLALPRERGQRLTFVHEWSRLQGYTPETREMLTEWGIRIRNDVDRIIVALRSDTSAIVRMGISVASIALRIAGVRLKLVDSIDDVIDELAIRPREGGPARSGS
jgi:hypothetical protein